MPGHKSLIVLKTLRVHQWIKNVLVFVPLLMAHKLFSPAEFWSSCLAFVAFSLAASFVYVCNDILDREADRQHRTKRDRPIASGAISVPQALVLAAAALCSALLAALQLPAHFGIILAAYLLVSSAYSVFLKRLMAADIVVLASLYTLRILAGAEASSVSASHWLLLFSMFIFLSLACVKRFSELRQLQLSNKTEAHGRGYSTEDLELISQCGSSSGYLSVLVLALYVSSKEVTALYAHPILIYLICPLVLYWMTRTWLLAHRNEVHDDPVVFALTDRVSYIVGALGALVLYAAV